MNLPVQIVERLYAQSGDPDIPVQRVIADLHAETDAALADAIQTDGLIRLHHDLPTELSRYLEAIPDLTLKPEAMDAAISVALASMARRLQDKEKPADVLSRQYPRLERFIRDAALLDEVVLSTNGLAEAIDRSRGERALPMDFGPMLASGLARYRLINSLGMGAVGEVFLATDRQLSGLQHQALVAVKILRTSRGQHHTAQAEAVLTRRIDHPNVVRVLDRGTDDRGETYIVYEFMPGGSLSRLLARRGGRLPAAEGAMLVSRIAGGVQAVHAAGLTHCDLKPGNVLLTRNEEPKVGDFGVAMLIEQLDFSRSSESQIGNVAFISPEQYRREPGALSPTTDVYALGGILYLVLTGLLPNGSTPAEVAMTHHRRTGRREPPRLRDRSRGIDTDLEAICRRALEPRPQDRYQTACEFSNDLEAWCQGFSIPWRRNSPLRRARLLMRRHKMVAGLALALTGSILVGGGAVVYFAQRAAEEHRVLRGQIEAALAVRGSLPGLVSLEVKAAGQWLLNTPAQSEYRANRVRSLAETVRIVGSTGDAKMMPAAGQETKLLVWMLLGSDGAATLERVDRVIKAWRAAVPENDPWISRLSLLENAARANLLLAQQPGRDSAVVRSEARTLADKLAGLVAALPADESGDGLASIGMSALVRLNSPHGTGDSAEADRWRKAIRARGCVEFWVQDSPGAPTGEK